MGGAGAVGIAVGALGEEASSASAHGGASYMNLKEVLSDGGSEGAGSLAASAFGDTGESPYMNGKVNDPRAGQIAGRSTSGERAASVGYQNLTDAGLAIGGGSGDLTSPNVPLVAPSTPPALRTPPPRPSSSPLSLRPSAPPFPPVGDSSVTHR
jgi:hypothetical protein